MFSPSRKVICACALLFSGFIHWFSAAPVPRAASDVPIVWWSWRNQTPQAQDIAKAFSLTRSQTLFLRAGQIDLARGQLQRLRPAKGAFPDVVELHLVYNATRSLLAEFEKVAPDNLANVIAQSFQEDLMRAGSQRCHIAGLQLDIDAPVRLLPHYQQMLTALRLRLPVGTKLSVTGLPAWFDSPALPALLNATDFWIPQCYGAEIPRALESRVSIASPRETRRAIERARWLGKPFYAGLAAYGYALHFAVDGQRLALRGDLDPVLAATHPDLTQGECQHNDGEWRCLYQAKRDCVVDGLVLRANERLALQLTTAASLQANARAAREQGGHQLLGLCIFRLPGADDNTSLSAVEIAVALTDQSTEPDAVCKAEISQSEQGEILRVELLNTGSARPSPAEGALTLSVFLPAQHLAIPHNLSQFNHLETLCEGPSPADLVACSPLRAEWVRLSAPAWTPGTMLRAVWRLRGNVPETLPIQLKMQTNDGREWRMQKILALKEAASK